jgi:hypothetical protein
MGAEIRQPAEPIFRGGDLTRDARSHAEARLNPVHGRSTLDPERASFVTFPPCENRDVRCTKK